MYTFARITVFLVALTGCGAGGPPPVDMGGEDGLLVARLIEDLNDAKGSPKTFTPLFAKGSPALTAGNKKYFPFNYSVIGKPSVTGAEATAKVLVSKDQGGAEVGKLDWAFVKEDDKWKIKAAPLP